MQSGLIDVPSAGFAAAVRDFFAGGGRGLNVTVPTRKLRCRVRPPHAPCPARGRGQTLAASTGADTNALLGDNTDGAGLVRISPLTWATR